MISSAILHRTNIIKILSHYYYSWLHGGKNVFPLVSPSIYVRDVVQIRRWRNVRAYTYLACLLRTHIILRTNVIFFFLVPSAYLCISDIIAYVHIITINTSTTIFYFLFFYHHFYLPPQLVGGLTLSKFLDKPWWQVPSLFPPVRAFNFYRA